MKILCITSAKNNLVSLMNNVCELLEGTLDYYVDYEMVNKNINHYDVIVHDLHKDTLDLSVLIEVTHSNSNILFIPLLKSERGSEQVLKLFSADILDGLFFDEVDAETLALKMRHSRNKRQAKSYYGLGIRSESISFKSMYHQLEQSELGLEMAFEQLIKELDEQHVEKLVNQMPNHIKSELIHHPIIRSYESTVLHTSTTDSKTWVIEKTKTEIKEVEKTEIVHQSVMRRKLFTVVGNAELCAEMAYVNAKYTEESILLIDLDTYTPEIHRVYGMKETVNTGITIKNTYTASSFLQAYEVAATRQLNYDILRNIAVKFKYEHLHILTGNDIIQKGEGFNVEPLKDILEVALSAYSIVYVNIPFDPYKALNLFMMLNPKSTLLMPFNGGAIDLVNKKRMIKFIKDTNHLEMKNLKYVAFEYNSSNHIEEKELKKLTDGQYLGSVHYDHQRVKSRNHLQGTHIHHLSRKTEDEYRELLTKLGIPLKVKLREKFERLLRKNK